MNEEAAFIAALVAEPSDRAAALVFADWLEERGDPRGPMLRIDEVRAWMAPTYADPLPDLAAALETGKKVTQASKLLALIGEAAVPTLLALLRHATPIVRLRAVKALRLMGGRAKSAIPVLTELVKESGPENADVRQEAVRVLGALRVKGAVKDELAKGLDSSDAAERLAAVQAMSKLRTKTAADSLCKALADSSGDVRRAAAQQLRYVAGPTTPFAVEPLRKALADADAVVRSMAVVALRKIGPEAAAAAPDLLRIRDRTTGKERTELVEALGEVGVGIPEVLEVVLEELRGPTGTREAARVALTKWPAIPAPAAPALLEIVRNPNSGSPYWDGQLVRAGLQALARIVPPPPEVLAELRTQLAGERAVVVAGALGEIGPPAAPLLPELTAAFYRLEKHGNAYAIAKAIGQIGGEGIAALAQALGRAPTKDNLLPAAAAAG